MDDVWQVQEAKARFGEVIDRALSEGPQTVTRHGKAVVKVVAIAASSEPPEDDGFVDYLLSAPRVLPDGLPKMPRRNRKAPPKLGE